MQIVFFVPSRCDSLLFLDALYWCCHADRCPQHATANTHLSESFRNAGLKHTTYNQHTWKTCNACVPCLFDVSVSHFNVTLESEIVCGIRGVKRESGRKDRKPFGIGVRYSERRAHPFRWPSLKSTLRFSARITDSK